MAWLRPHYLSSFPISDLSVGSESEGVHSHLQWLILFYSLFAGPTSIVGMLVTPSLDAISILPIWIILVCSKSVRQEVRASLFRDHRVRILKKSWRIVFFLVIFGLARKLAFRLQFSRGLSYTIWISKHEKAQVHMWHLLKIWEDRWKLQIAVIQPYLIIERPAQDIRLL